MKKNILKLIIILILFLAYQYSSKSDCPDDVTGWYEQQTADFAPSQYDWDFGNVKYSYRYNQGNYEVKIDWSTFLANWAYLVNIRRNKVFNVLCNY